MNAIKGTLLSMKNKVMKFPKIRFIPKKSNNFRISTISGRIKIIENILLILYTVMFFGIFNIISKIVDSLNIVARSWNLPPPGIRAVIFANEPISIVYMYKFVMLSLPLKYFLIIGKINTNIIE